MREEDVLIPVDELQLEGRLLLPEHARGMVIIVDGGGRTRSDPRDQRLTRLLQQRDLATLLLDLLTIEEDADDQRTGNLRFDVGLLARRLETATRWLRRDVARSMPVGFLGAGMGAAAAVAAAAALPQSVAAVVSLGGRPDLAGPALRQVTAPTLLIVGRLDTNIVHLNERALDSMLRAKKRLEIVPDARHDFVEPGALEEAEELMGEWFEEHFVRPRVALRPEAAAATVARDAPRPV